MPVLVNEDDHFRFNEPENHMMEALKQHASWGFFEPGKSDYVEGYQCPPVNWGIDTAAQTRVLRQIERGHRSVNTWQPERSSHPLSKRTSAIEAHASAPDVPIRSRITPLQSEPRP